MATDILYSYNVPHEFECQWLNEHNYAVSPDFGIRRAFCPVKHESHAKIYHYTAGGYYRCFGCVQEEIKRDYEQTSGNER